MNTSTLKDTVARGTVLLAIGALVTVLAGCSSPVEEATDSPSTSASSEASTPDETEVDDTAVKDDLEAARGVVAAALVSYPDAAQIVLSSSATEVTFAYGAVQAPFLPSEATDRIKGSVVVVDGSFEITATSAASGTEYTIDQDGVIS